MILMAYINDSVPKAMGVDYATNIAKVRDDMHEVLIQKLM